MRPPAAAVLRSVSWACPGRTDAKVQKKSSKDNPRVQAWMTTVSQFIFFRSKTDLVYRHEWLCRSECSNDWGGGDTTIPSPGRSPKQPYPGIGLHDPLHGRKACPEFSSVHRGVCQINPREGLFSCRPLPKRGKTCDIPAPPNR